MPSSDSFDERSPEAEGTTATRLFNGKAAVVLQALYRAQRPIGFGELMESINQDGKAVLTGPSLTRNLLALEEIGAVEAMTSRPPGQRRGFAVLYRVQPERIDELLEAYGNWIRGGGSSS